jgi:hypothetical protein
VSVAPQVAVDCGRRPQAMHEPPKVRAWRLQHRP